MIQINRGSDAITLFGSFFFVLEMKGFKLFTKETFEPNHMAFTSTLDHLRQEFSALDWTYMMDRQNGELYSDIGISYHPVSSKPLVGLWRLDSLEASYGLAGYAMGEIHHLNTLDGYGALQAEMSTSRSPRNHIVFRSSYNLVYEGTRCLDNKRDLLKEKEAYSLDRSYLWQLEQVRSSVNLKTL